MIAYRPAAPLDAIVERIWWSERARPSTTWEHHLPSGRAQLVIALHEEPIAWSARLGSEPHAWIAGVVHGPQASYYVAGPKPRGSVMGVSFRPGMAAFVLGVSACDLVERHVTLDDLWGASGRCLHDRLACAATPHAALGLLESALVARVRASPSLHPAVAHALRACERDAPLTRVAQMQRETGYSPRHFVALFRSAVGLTPKQYLRIVRFGTVLRQLAVGNVDTLADVAAANGYADQAHLTRDFRELAGVPPSAYRPPTATSSHHHIVAGGMPAAGSW